VSDENYADRSTQFTDDIVCPYCFYHHDADDHYEDCQMVCSGCDATFQVQVEYERTFNTCKPEDWKP